MYFTFNVGVFISKVNEDLLNLKDLANLKIYYFLKFNNENNVYF